VTVLVTHWWEYFRDEKPDDAFISVLHQLAEYLASRKDVVVTTFDALADGEASPAPHARVARPEETRSAAPA
ncbi:MAG TPA: hypothetical protein VM029_01140, partial [Opitutaceae bacterium]|nr:hypothetical protein [Opitutaceae bacterium]